MDCPSFCAVIGRLQLWDIDNMATHTGSRDETPISVLFKWPAIDVRPLFLLPSPDSTGRSRTIEGTIKISRYNLAIMVDIAIKHRALRPWNSSVGDEDV